jgi:hypothetical protein
MQSPSKANASAQERQLQQQGIARASSAEQVNKAVQPHFLKNTKQDATSALKARANADGAQQLNALVQGASDVQQKQNTQSAGINSLSGSAVQAHARALGDRDGKMINAANVGANQNSIALSGTSALASMQTSELNADLQRRVQKRSDNLGALTATATTGISAWGNNNGVFADGEYTNDADGKPVPSGRGILGNYGSGNNKAKASYDQKLFDSTNGA